MKDLTKIYVDLSKCSEEQIKAIPQILEKAGEKLSNNFKNGIKNNFEYLKFRFDNGINAWCVSGFKGVRTELTYPEFIKLFEEPKTITESIKEYFKNTPKEQVIKDWESVSEFDSVNSPKVSELFEGGENNNRWIKVESESDLPKEVGDYWAVWKDGEVGRKQFFCRTEKNLYSPNGNISEYDWWMRHITYYMPIIKPKPPKF